MRLLHLNPTFSFISVFAFAMLLFSAAAATAQHDAKAFQRLMEEKEKAATPLQKLNSALALADFHCNRSFMKTYSGSVDSAHYYLKTAKNISDILNTWNNQARTALAYSRMRELELKYEESVDYANQAVTLLENRPDKRMLAKAYEALYNSLRYISTPDQTMPVVKKMLKAAIDGKDDKLTGKAYYNLAENYSTLFDFDKTLESLDKAKFYYERGGVREMQNLYTFYGMMYTSRSDHARAFTANLKAVEIIEKNNIEDYTNVMAYMTVGNMYRDMKRFGTAIEYYDKAYALFDKYDLLRQKLMLSRFLASAHAKMKNFAEAEKYLRISEDWYYQVDYAYRDFVLMAVLDTYPDIGTPNRADRFVPDAVEYLDKQEPKKATYGMLSFGLAKYYFATKNYSEARKRAQSVIDYLSNTPARYKLYDPYRMLVRIDSINGDYLSALKNYNLASICKDSMTNIGKNYLYAELEIKYATGQQFKNNLLLKKQGELQKADLSRTELIRNVSFAGIVLLLTAVFLIYRRFRITQRLRGLLAAKNNELEEILEDKDMLLNEKEWLLREIHHRVKNNLQIVMSLLNSQSYFLNDDVAKKAIENSQHRIHSMSLIHKKLYQSDNIATINMSVYFWELMEYYKIAFDTGGRILFQLDVDPVELQSSQAVPVGLILNETVNNSLKHAFPGERKGIVKISFKCIGDDKVQLRISDDGIGYTGSLSDAGSSLGMKLIYGFTRDLSGNLEFNSETGLEVVVTFVVAGILDGRLEGISA